MHTSLQQALGSNIEHLRTGSMLEGGGQILRNAAALAAITGRAVRVRNIRANRSKPGLRTQQLAGLQLVARIAQAELTGAAVGSCAIVLQPGTLRGGQYSADPGTAGSCALLAQVREYFSVHGGC